MKYLCLWTLTHRKTKRRRVFNFFSFELSRKDSNFEWLNQNQLCYHYTTGQSLNRVNTSVLRVQRYYLFYNYQTFLKLFFIFFYKSLKDTLKILLTICQSCIDNPSILYWQSIKKVLTNHQSKLDILSICNNI